MPDSVDLAEVRRIAHLARLKLSDAECARLHDDLSQILAHFDKLKNLSTDGVEPTAHAIDIVNVLREDLPGEALGVEKTLANAPAREGPYFRVPKVLDQVDA